MCRRLKYLVEYHLMLSITQQLFTRAKTSFVEAHYSHWRFCSGTGKTTLVCALLPALLASAASTLHLQENIFSGLFIYLFNNC